MSTTVELDRCVTTETAAAMLNIRKSMLVALLQERPDLKPPLLDHSYYVWRPEDIERVREALREGQ